MRHEQVEDDQVGSLRRNGIGQRNGCLLAEVLDECSLLGSERPPADSTEHGDAENLTSSPKARNFQSTLALRAGEQAELTERTTGESLAGEQGRFEPLRVDPARGVQPKLVAVRAGQAVEEGNLRVSGKSQNASRTTLATEALARLRDELLAEAVDASPAGGEAGQEFELEQLELRGIAKEAGGGHDRGEQVQLGGAYPPA